MQTDAAPGAVTRRMHAPFWPPKADARRSARAAKAAATKVEFLHPGARRGPMTATPCRAALPMPRCNRPMPFAQYWRQWPAPAASADADRGSPARAAVGGGGRAAADAGRRHDAGASGGRAMIASRARLDHLSHRRPAGCAPRTASFALGTWAALQPVDRFAHRPARLSRPVCHADHRDGPALRPKAHRLTGPGITDRAQLSLPETAAFRANRALFPLGFDCLFTCGTQLAGLPRSAPKWRPSDVCCCQRRRARDRHRPCLAGRRTPRRC